MKKECKNCKFWAWDCMDIGGICTSKKKEKCTPKHRKCFEPSNDFSEIDSWPNWTLKPNESIGNPNNQTLKGVHMKGKDVIKLEIPSGEYCNGCMFLCLNVDSVHLPQCRLFNDEELKVDWKSGLKSKKGIKKNFRCPK